MTAAASHQPFPDRAHPTNSNGPGTPGSFNLAASRSPTNTYTTIEDEEYFEIIDYTSVSPWERFITSVEQVIYNWGVDAGRLGVFDPAKLAESSSSATHAIQNEIVMLGDAAYSLEYHCLPILKGPHQQQLEDGTPKPPNNVDAKSNSNETAGEKRNSALKVPSPATTVSPHPLHRWTGLRYFLLLTPFDIYDSELPSSRRGVAGGGSSTEELEQNEHNPSGFESDGAPNSNPFDAPGRFRASSRDTTSGGFNSKLVATSSAVTMDVSTTKLLVSSFSIAFQNTGCAIPAFVPTGPPWKSLYSGYMQLHAGSTLTKGGEERRGLVEGWRSILGSAEYSEESLGNEGLSDVEVRFRSTYSPFVPPHLGHVEGLLKLFTERAGLTRQPGLNAPIDVCGTLTYRIQSRVDTLWHERACWRPPPPSLPTIERPSSPATMLTLSEEGDETSTLQEDDDALPPITVSVPFGTPSDPLLFLNLEARFPNAPASFYLRESDLEATMAAVWTLSAQFQSDVAVSRNAGPVRIDGTPYGNVPAATPGAYHRQPVALSERKDPATKSPGTKHQMLSATMTRLLNGCVEAARKAESGNGGSGGGGVDPPSVIGRAVNSGAVLLGVGSAADSRRSAAGALLGGTAGVHDLIDPTDVEATLKTLFISRTLHAPPVRPAPAQASARFTHPASSSLAREFRQGSFGIPPRSFLWTLCIHLLDAASATSHLNYQNTQPHTFLKALWPELVRKIRVIWESGGEEYIPDVWIHGEGEAMGIDLRYNVLHQKLAMLNCCVWHRKMEEKRGGKVAKTTRERERRTGAPVSPLRSALENTERPPIPESHLHGQQQQPQYQKIAYGDANNVTAGALSVAHISRRLFTSFSDFVGTSTAADPPANTTTATGSSALVRFFDRITGDETSTTPEPDVRAPTPGSVPVPPPSKTVGRPGSMALASSLSEYEVGGMSWASDRSWEDFSVRGGGGGASLMRGSVLGSHGSSGEIVRRSGSVSEPYKRRSGNEKTREARNLSEEEELDEVTEARGSSSRGAREGGENGDIFLDTLDDIMTTPSETTASAVRTGTEHGFGTRRGEEDEDASSFMSGSMSSVHQGLSMSLGGAPSGMMDSYVQLGSSLSGLRGGSSTDLDRTVQGGGLGSGEVAGAEPISFLKEPLGRTLEEVDEEREDGERDGDEEVDGEGGGEWEKVSEGQLRPMEGVCLLKTGQPLYIPKTQDIGYMTEDMIREQELIFERLGTSAEAARARARMQSAHLKSDMEAFKAANPGCCLEDFVRWHSPRDWVPDEEGAETEAAGENPVYVKGQLSARMREPGNLWEELWKSTRPVPVSRQKSLFDHSKEAEKVLRYLERTTAQEAYVMLFPTMFLVAYETLSSQPVGGEISLLSDLLKKLGKKIVKTDWRSVLSHQSEGEKVEIDRHALEDLILDIREIEGLMSMAIALLRKLPGQHDLIERILVQSEARVRDGAEREAVWDLSRNGDGSFTSPTFREFVFQSAKPWPSNNSRTMPQRMYALLRDGEFRLVESVAKDGLFM